MLHGTPADAILTNTTETEVIAAQGVNSHIYIHKIILSNQDSTDTFVDFNDSTTTRLRKLANPAGLGATYSFNERPVRLDSNEPLNAQQSASVNPCNITVVYTVGSPAA